MATMNGRVLVVARVDKGPKRTIAQSVANKYKMQKIIAIKATKCSQKAYKLWAAAVSTRSRDGNFPREWGHIHRERR